MGIMRLRYSTRALARGRVFEYALLDNAISRQRVNTERYMEDSSCGFAVLSPSFPCACRSKPWRRFWAMRAPKSAS